MKRFVCLALICTVALSLFGFSLADTPQTIQFRSLEWYTPFDEVNAAIRAISGVTVSSYGSVNENAKIESWYRRWQYSYTDDAVENGGVIANYRTVPVAGYTADLELSFIYPIIDGRISYDRSDAQFYMARYKIDDLTDLHAVYDNLKGKLEGIYGPSSPMDGYYLVGAQWTASDGSIVWLGLRQNSVYENYEYVQLTYYAPNGSARLAQLAEQIFQEAADAEAEERLQNQDNNEGL